MSLVRLHLNRLGHVELSFVNAKTVRRLLAVAVAKGGPAEATAYIQHDEDVQALVDTLPRRARGDLLSGWDINVRIDGWQAAHYFGHDAHTAFESP